MIVNESILNVPETENASYVIAEPDDGFTVRVVLVAALIWIL